MSLGFVKLMITTLLLKNKRATLFLTLTPLPAVYSVEPIIRNIYFSVQSLLEVVSNCKKG